VPALYLVDKPLLLDNRLLFVVSMLLSVWLVLMDPVLNRDAILYLRAADAYLEHGFAAAMALYDRPFLPILFGHLHDLTGLRMDLAALLVLGLLYSLLVIVFVAIVRLLGGSREVQLLAALLILVHPEINAYRSSIVRDPGFWAFALLAVYALLRYARDPGIMLGLWWFLALLVATLFRFEALFLVALGPLFLLGAIPGRRGLRVALPLWVPPMILGALVYVLVLGRAPADEEWFPHISYYFQQAASWRTQFDVASTAIADHLLAFTSVVDAPVAAFGALLAVLIITIARALMWPVLALWIVGRWCGGGLHWTRAQHWLVWGHVAICLLYLSLFLLVNRFVIERYTGLLVVLLLLPLPFWIDALWRRYGALTRVLLVLLLAGLCVDTLHNSNYRKGFIADGTDWIRRNAPVNAPLLSNEPHLAYFSDRPVDFQLEPGHTDFFDVLQSRPGLIRAHHYIALNVRDRDRSHADQLLTDDALRELAVFGGGRYGTLLILQNRDFSPLLNLASMLERSLPPGAVLHTNEVALLEMLPPSIRVDWNPGAAVLDRTGSDGAQVLFVPTLRQARALATQAEAHHETLMVPGEDGRTWLLLKPIR